MRFIKFILNLFLFFTIPSIALAQDIKFEVKQDICNKATILISTLDYRIFTHVFSGFNNYIEQNPDTDLQEIACSIKNLFYQSVDSLSEDINLDTKNLNKIIEINNYLSSLITLRFIEKIEIDPTSMNLPSLWYFTNPNEYKNFIQILDLDEDKIDSNLCFKYSIGNYSSNIVLPYNKHELDISYVNIDDTLRNEINKDICINLFDIINSLISNTYDEQENQQNIDNAIAILNSSLISKIDYEDKKNLKKMVSHIPKLKRHIKNLKVSKKRRHIRSSIKNIDLEDSQYRGCPDYEL